MASVLDTKYGTVDGGDSISFRDGVPMKATEFSKTLIVLGDNTSQNDGDILASSAVPILGFPERGCFLRSRHATEIDIVTNPVTLARCGLWEVELKYDQEMIAVTNDTEIWWSGEEESVAFMYDVLTGRRPMTTAGEQIASEYENDLPILHVKRLEDYPYDPINIINYVGRTNSISFYGAPPGTARLLPIETSREIVDGVSKSMVTYHVKFKFLTDFLGNLIQDSWQALLLNRGQLYRRSNIGSAGYISGVTPTTSVEVFKDVSGHVAETNLDINGYQLLDSPGTGLSLIFSDLNRLGLGGFNYPLVRDGSALFSPQIADVGSSFNIKTGGTWFGGIYNVIGVVTVSGVNYWILDNPPASGFSASGGQYTLQRAPIYLKFYRYYPVNLNNLNLGP